MTQYWLFRANLSAEACNTVLQISNPLANIRLGLKHDYCSVWEVTEKFKQIVIFTGQLISLSKLTVWSISYRAHVINPAMCLCTLCMILSYTKILLLTSMLDTHHFTVFAPMPSGCGIFTIQARLIGDNWALCFFTFSFA